MLGTANFQAGPVMAFASGNLCYQIEHHLFPDLPSNRYAEIGIRVRELCEKFDLPYTTGSLCAVNICKRCAPSTLLRCRGLVGQGDVDRAGLWRPHLQDVSHDVDDRHRPMSTSTVHGSRLDRPVA